jgi:hypothetical protein
MPPRRQLGMQRPCTTRHQVLGAQQTGGEIVRPPSVEASLSTATSQEQNGFRFRHVASAVQVAGAFFARHHVPLHGCDKGNSVHV